MNTYDPVRFSDVAHTKLGQDLWAFLWEHDNLVRLETACELDKPAIEALATRLVARFGQDVRQDRIKQMLGHMTRQILEARGFVLDRQGVKVRAGDLFTVASKYKRR